MDRCLPACCKTGSVAGSRHEQAVQPACAFIFCLQRQETYRQPSEGAGPYDCLANPACRGMRTARRVSWWRIRPTWSTGAAEPAATGAGGWAPGGRSASERLARGGTRLLFTSVAIKSGEDPFRDEVEPILRATGFRTSYREVDPDVFGEELAHAAYDRTDRIALVVLTATRPAA